MCKRAFALQDSPVSYCGNQFFLPLIDFIFQIYLFNFVLIILATSFFMWDSECLFFQALSIPLSWVGVKGLSPRQPCGALLLESWVWNGAIAWYLPAWNLKESIFSKTHLQPWHCHFKVCIKRKHVSGENCCFSSVSTIFNAQSKPSVEFWVTKQVPPGSDLLPSTWFN